MNRSRNNNDATVRQLAIKCSLLFSFCSYVFATPFDMKPGVQYVVLRIIPVDNKRYKYTNGVWHALCVAPMLL